MTRLSIAASCALALAALSLTPAAFAGTGKDVKETKVLQEAVKESCITGDLGVAVVSEYISRGVVNENQGVIAQPYLDLYFKLYEGNGFLNKVSLNLGIWSSINSNKTAASPGTSLPAWYEFDWTPGMTFTFAKNFALNVTWYDFDFVSSGGRAAGLGGTLTYDDTDLLGAFALHPHGTVIKGMIGNFVGVPGGDHAWYYEVGIAPGFTVAKSSAYPLTVTVPVTVGLGSETYAGEAYGYTSVGITTSVPLAFVPSCYGKWALTAGATYWNLGNNAAQASAPGLTDGDKNQFVFSGSLGLTF